MSAILFIVILFVLVLVHEWGHFITAKKTGMRVDEFGFGFPPRLFGIKKGETLYSMNAIPLGGFVKIYGEDLDAEITEDRARAFGARPLWAQALVLVAGVTMNILFAWILFSLAFFIGTRTMVDEATAGKDAMLTVLSIIPGSPADDVGLKPGDSILKVTSGEGSAIDRLYPSAVSDFIGSHDSVTVTFAHKDTEKTVTVSPKAGFAPQDKEKKVLGITMGLMEVTSKPAHLALYEGGLYTLSSIKMVAMGIVGLLKDALFFRADLSGVSGPIGIAGLVGEAASFGVTSLLLFTAFISLNLAVINLLPFPALDGGRLIFVCIEAIKGSPVPSRVAYAINAIGFLLLMTLMVVVSYHDILRML